MSHTLESQNPPSEFTSPISEVKKLDRFGQGHPQLTLKGWKRKAASWLLGGDPTPTAEQEEDWRELFFAGDPLADDVVKMYSRLPPGQGRKLLLKALDEGIDQVENPPEELLALFQKVERDPIWLNRDLLQKGAEVCQRIGLSADFFLRSGALMGGYQSAAITKPLVYTGSLGGKVTSVRRIVETSQFWLDVTSNNNMGRFDDGFKTTIQVRMMHALSRRKVSEAKNWREDKWGLPINQADMAMTNFGFCVFFLIGARLQGYLISRTDSEAVMHLWRYVGFLIGVKEELLPSTEREAIRLAYAFISQAYDSPDEDSLELAHALRDMPLIGADTWFKKRLGKQEMLMKAGFTRFFTGDKTGAALDLPFSWFWRAVPYFQPLIVFPIELLSFLLPPVRRRWQAFGRRCQMWNFARDRKQLNLLVGEVKAQVEFRAVDSLTEKAG